MTSRRWLHTEAEDRVRRLNRLLVGWANYFVLGQVSPAYRAVDRHVQGRLRWWLCNKHKVEGRGRTRFPYQYLCGELGLTELEPRVRSFPWAKA